MKHAASRAWVLSEHAVRKFFADRCTQLAAGISYFALFSLFPTAIVMAAIFGVIVDDEQARREVVDFLVGNLPLSEEQGRADLENLLQGVARNSEAIGIAGLAGVLISASALMGAVRNSLNAVWDVEHTRPPLQGKALDILFVLGLGVLIALSLAITVVTRFATDLSEGLGVVGEAVQAVPDAAGWLLPIILSLVVFTILFRIIPPPVDRVRDIWPGVVAATVGYELARQGFSFYLENFGNYSAVYGSLGAVVAFLVFIYVAAMIVLLGAEYAQLWPRVRAGHFDTDEEPDEPLGRRILSALKGLAVDQRGR